MNDTIGSRIGVVGHTLSITNVKDEKVQLNIKIDYSTATDTDIKSWLNSNRVIAGQRPWRSLTADELKAMDGMTFNATTIGQKVKSLRESTSALLNQFNGKSREEIIDSFMSNPSMTLAKAEMLANAMLSE
jgi:hypothetical protein